MLGKIYKLTPHKCCEFYIGSTWNMKERKKTHINDAVNKTYKIYEKIREMGGFDMEVLYEYECANETELRMEEQRCIDKMKPILNTYRAYISDEDRVLRTIRYRQSYYEKNKEVLIEKQKQYYEQNKEKVATKDKKYREANKDVILDKSKQYREQNREVIRVKQKEYNEKNKEVLKQKITCDCGCVVAKRTLNKHKRTNKHIKLMEQQTIMG